MTLKVVETTQELNRCRQVIENSSESVSLYLPSDVNLHPVSNRMSLSYHSVGGASWVIGHFHNDLKKMSIVHFPSSSTIDGVYFNLGGIDYSYWLTSPHFSDYYTNNQKEYHRKFYGVRNINDAIPLNMHLEYFRELEKEIRGQELKADLSNTSKIFASIERNGIAVNEEVFARAYGEDKAANLIHDGMVYSHYNPYTTTGRPSNAWGTVNFAAIPKKGEHRSAFVSRYDDGILLNMDFKSFHLYLLAWVMKYNVPEKNIHEYLGKHYFGVEKLTEEQYELSKKYTFQQLYGDSDRNVPFLGQLKELKEDIWTDYQNGQLKSHLWGRPFNIDQDLTANMVFNYWVQNLETEWMVSFIELLKSKTDKVIPILYTYDSMLFDLKKEDLDECVKLISNLSQKTNFPCTIEVGNDYGSMKCL